MGGGPNNNVAPWIKVEDVVFIESHFYVSIFAIMFKEVLGKLLLMCRQVCF